uniref:hypothetical protein n=1 Tax=Lentzea alba TaxID=2714351 RepID=UPI0039BF2BDB
MAVRLGRKAEAAQLAGFVRCPAVREHRRWSQVGLMLVAVACLVVVLITGLQSGFQRAFGLGGGFGVAAPTVLQHPLAWAAEGAGSMLRTQDRSRAALAAATSDLTADLHALAEKSGSPVRTSIRPAHSGGFGPVGMRERVSELGGRFFAGATGEGWLVTAGLPLEVRV